MDRISKQKRSWNMSQIRSKNTKPELLMFSLLKNSGIKFKKHYDIIGKPDIAFPKYKLAVFIDGEFWHGKDFKRIQESINPFWIKKLGDNIKRDRRTVRKLRKEGWHILHLWDKRVIKYPTRSLQRVLRFLDRIKTSGGNLQV